MIAAGLIVDNVLAAMNKRNDPEKRAMVWRVLNQKYFQICRSYSWRALRDTLSLDFSASGTDGSMWLPSNLFGVDRVMDDTNEIEFIERDRADVSNEEDIYRFFCFQGEDSDLFYSAEASVDKGSSSFSCDELGATDHTGEYITLGSEPGFYLLTAAKTFTPAYYGPKIDLKDIRIRPRDTQKMIILDPQEDFLDERTVTVHYWKAPQPLYRDSDVPILPDCDVLELSILQVMPEAKLRRPIKDSDVEDARKRAQALNPNAPRPSRPRGVKGEVFNLSTTRTAYYGTR